MKISQEDGENLRASLDAHADKIRPLDRRGLLNAKYEPPSRMLEDDGSLNMNDPRIKAMVDKWTDVMRDWKARYGDAEGYEEFRAYANYVQEGAAYMDLFTKERYKRLRDRFGFATEETLYNYRPEDIAAGEGDEDYGNGLYGNRPA